MRTLIGKVTEIKSLITPNFAHLMIALRNSVIILINELNRENPNVYFGTKRAMISLMKLSRILEYMKLED